MVAERVTNTWFETEWTDSDLVQKKKSSPSSLPKPFKCRTVHDVVKTGTLEAVEFLVDKYGTKILCEKDDNGHTAAHWACLGGHLNIIKYMVESGVSVNISSSSHIGAYPIHWACVEGHVSIVDFLLKNGVSINIRDRNGCTPLITSCQHGNSHLVCYLLGRGANKSICDRNGDTALHWAAYKERLLEKQQAIIGMSYLKNAADGYPDLMRLLIYSGFDPRLQDNFGYNALHLACLSGNLVAVEDLCEKDKIELETKDEQNKTPMQLAEEQGQKDIVDYLKEKKRKSFWPSFDLWQLVFGVTSHSKGPLFFLLGTLFCWGYPMYLLRCVPLTWDEYTPIHFVFLVTNGVMWVSLIIAHNQDPGYLALDTEDYHRTINELAKFDKFQHNNMPMPQLCHTCRTVRPLRAKHCRICNRCIRHFDHHCPYIYNCVGLNNRIWFLVFSLTIAINCSVTVFFAAACIWREGWQYTYIFGLLEAIFFCGVGWILSGSTISVRQPMSDNCWKRVLVVILYAAYNLTMNEAFNCRRYRYLKDGDGHYHNPFNRGIMENIKEFFHCTRVWDIHDVIKVEETV